jgi:arylsulfatase
MMSEYGCNSAVYGKWHNTPPSDIKPGGPYDQYPTGLGFRYFYGFIAGETSQYERASLKTSTQSNPRTIPAITWRTIWLKERKPSSAINWHTPRMIFFPLLCPGAVHGPHHVFKE